MSMTLISTVTVGSGGQAQILFSSIPSTFTDLFLVVSLRTDHPTTTWNDAFVRPNSDTSNASSRILFGDGSNRSSYTATQIVIRSNGGTSTSSTFSSCSVYMPNYLSNTAKSFSVDEVTENNQTTALQAIGAGLWTGTAAISSLRLDSANGNFAQHSSASLYGITAGSSGGVIVS